MRNIGYVAVDHGPSLTLQLLTSHLGGAWLDSNAREPGAFIEQLQRKGIELLVCGTSDSPHGRMIEATARTASTRLAVPILVVEDFPGNFTPVADGNPRLLCVESSFAADLARQKLDDDLSVHIGPSLRYDGLRSKLDALRSSGCRAGETAALWIGQPETGDALETLRVVTPALRAQDCALWFRAHPRDEGYRNGAYETLLSQSGVTVRDMTHSSLDDCLARRPRLVVTQFSSVGVEAGFWGIPSLNVLLPGAGGGRLLERKGYAVPPWCDGGAAFFVIAPLEVEEVLESAMRSERAREQIQKRFDDYFKVREEGAPGLINVLYNQGFM